MGVCGISVWRGWLAQKRGLALLLGGTLIAFVTITGSWASGRIDQSAEAGFSRVRWGNVSIAVPAPVEGPRLVLAPLVDDQGRLVLRLKPVDASYQLLVIDASDGTVIYDNIDGENRILADDALATLTVGPVQDGPAPWPYSGDGEGIPRQSFGDLSFIPPDPDSGIFLQSISEYGGPGSIRFWNGRSAVRIDAKGVVDLKRSAVTPEDKDAFDRLLATVRVGVAQ